MKFIILGGTGLLGKALTKELKSRHQTYVTMARSCADFCFDIRDDNALQTFIETQRPDVLINACAIVNHQFCEEHKEQAYFVNARPSSILAPLADKLNFKYVYISTDGYFRGDKNKKHDEQSPITLQNEYARTKFCGEQFSRLAPHSLIVRTNIVGFKGAQTPTFLEWALQAIQQRERITLFDDYFVSSIFVGQFSKALLDLIIKNATGLYNVASREVFSKKQFIETMATTFNLPLINAQIGSVHSLPSKRAESLGLDVSKAESVLGYELPNLKEVLVGLKEEYDELHK